MPRLLPIEVMCWVKICVTRIQRAFRYWIRRGHTTRRILRDFVRSFRDVHSGCMCYFCLKDNQKFGAFIAASEIAVVRLSIISQYLNKIKLVDVKVHLNFFMNAFFIANHPTYVFANVNLSKLQIELEERAVAFIETTFSLIEDISKNNKSFGDVSDLKEFFGKLESYERSQREWLFLTRAAEQLSYTYRVRNELFVLNRAEKGRPIEGKNVGIGADVDSIKSACILKLGRETWDLIRERVTEYGEGDEQNQNCRRKIGKFTFPLYLCLAQKYRVWGENWSDLNIYYETFMEDDGVVKESFWEANNDSAKETFWRLMEQDLIEFYLAESTNLLLRASKSSRVCFILHSLHTSILEDFEEFHLAPSPNFNMLETRHDNGAYLEDDEFLWKIFRALFDAMFAFVYTASTHRVCQSKNMHVYNLYYKQKRPQDMDKAAYVVGGLRSFFEIFYDMHIWRLKFSFLLNVKEELSGAHRFCYQNATIRAMVDDFYYRPGNKSGLQKLWAASDSYLQQSPKMFVVYLILSKIKDIQMHVPTLAADNHRFLRWNRARDFILFGMSFMFCLKRDSQYSGRADCFHQWLLRNQDDANFFKKVLDGKFLGFTKSGDATAFDVPMDSDQSMIMGIFLASNKQRMEASSSLFGMRLNAFISNCIVQPGAITVSLKPYSDSVDPLINAFMLDLLHFYDKHLLVYGSGVYSKILLSD